MSVWIFYGLLRLMKVWKRNLGCASKESTFTKIYFSKKFNVKYILFSKCLKKITGSQDPFLKKFILKISESSNKSTPLVEERFSKIAINWNFPYLFYISFIFDLLNNVFHLISIIFQKRIISNLMSYFTNSTTRIL